MILLRLRKRRSPLAFVRRSQRFGAFYRDCNGSILAEFAMIVPALLLLFFGLIEFGRVMWYRNALQSAVEDAARCYALNLAACDTTAKVQQYAVDAALGFSPALSTFTPTTETCGKQVTASYAVTSIVPVVPMNITVEASACRPTA